LECHPIFIGFIGVFYGTNFTRHGLLTKEGSAMLKALYGVGYGGHGYVSNYALRSVGYF
jgi:hypothetical protein